MNGRTSTIRVFGSSLVADPFAPQFRAYRYGGDQPEPAPKPQKPVVRVCAADGCDRAPHAKGHCERHYRKLLAGKPMDGDNRRKRRTSMTVPDVQGRGQTHEGYGVG